MPKKNTKSESKLKPNFVDQAKQKEKFNKVFEKMNQCRDLSLNAKDDKIRQAANQKIVELFDSIAYEEPLRGNEFCLSESFHFMASFLMFNDDQFDDYNKIIEYCNKSNQLLDNQNNFRVENVYIKIMALLKGNFELKILKATFDQYIDITNKVLAQCPTEFAEFKKHIAVQMIKVCLEISQRFMDSGEADACLKACNIGKLRVIGKDVEEKCGIVNYRLNLDIISMEALIFLDIISMEALIFLKNYEDAFTKLEISFNNINFIKKNKDLLKHFLSMFNNFRKKIPESNNCLLKKKFQILTEKIIKKDIFDSDQKDIKSYALFDIGLSAIELGCKDESIRILEESKMDEFSKSLADVFICLIQEQYKEAIKSCYSLLSQVLSQTNISPDFLLELEKTSSISPKFFSESEKILDSVKLLNILEVCLVIARIQVKKLGYYDKSMKLCSFIIDLVEFRKNIIDKDDDKLKLIHIVNTAKGLTALCYIKQGKIEEADKIFNIECIAVKTIKNWKIQDFLLVISFLSKNQKYEKAIRFIDGYEFKDNPEIQLKKASILIKKREITKAEIIFREMIKSKDISDELRDQANLELEIIEAINKKADEEAYLSTHMPSSSSSSLVYQYKKEKSKTRSESLRDLVELKLDNPEQVKSFLKSVTKPLKRQDEPSEVWNFQGGKKIESKNVVKVNKEAKYNLYTALAENLIKEIDKAQIKQILTAMEKFARSEVGDSGIKFLKGGGVELKLLGNKGLGDIRLWSDHLVKNDKGELLIIFNHVGDHTDIENFARGFSSSILTELPYDIHEFESGLLGDIEPSDLYEG